MEEKVTTHVDLPHAGDHRFEDLGTNAVTILTAPRSQPGVSAPTSARRGRSTRKVRVMAADFVTAAVAAVAAALTWAGSTDLSLRDHRWLVVSALLALPLLLANCGLYRAGLLARRVHEVRRLASAVALWFAGLVAIEQVAGVSPDNGLLLVVAAVVFGALVAERELTRRIFEHMRASGNLVRRAIVVGNRDAVIDIAKSFEHSPRGYAVVGVTLIDHELDSSMVDTLPSLGSISLLRHNIDQLDVDTVIIATSGVEPACTTRLMRQLAETGVHVELSFAVRDVAHDRMVVTERGRLTVAHILPPVRRGWRAAAKRSFDTAIAAGVIVVTAPVLALIAIAIKLDSPGPVFFRQQRVGKRGKLFSIIKLRTMVTNAEAMKAELASRNEAESPLFKLRNDPRVTRVGRFLRKTSLDELPQLWNVVRGHMSLVGPRPALPDEVAAWTPDLHHRLLVRPGLTGLWQISGRSDSSFETYEHLDLYYTDNWSLARDVWIILRTVPAVIAQRGAR
jgi:exopolysaccharide biosynthesis polyprenyl glycosylphosphotransferase